jgi:ATP-dependent RNA helicase DDX56/DBP9
MKRKLDANDVPSTETPDAASAKEITFESLNLDPRLRQALVKENFSKPTLVQSEAIPLALEGKDILGKLFYSVRMHFAFRLFADEFSARAKTGSGKTAAYVLPVLQSILQKRAVRNYTYFSCSHVAGIVC